MTGLVDLSGDAMALGKWLCSGDAGYIVYVLLEKLGLDKGDFS